MTITEAFDTYCGNIKKEWELDSGLFDTSGPDIWKEKLLSRAEKLRQFNRENGDLLRFLNEKAENCESREEADELRECAVSSIIDGMSDAALQYPVLKKLAGYYKSAGDIAAYISCLYYAGFIEGEILFRSGARDNVSSAADQAVVAEREHYAEIDDPDIRTFFFMSYHNLAICDVEGRSALDSSYRYLLEMEEFWHSPAVQQLDGQNELFIRYMNDTRRLWLQAPFLPCDKGTEACEYYCASAKAHYDAMVESTGGDVKKYLIQTYGPYLNSLVIKGELTYSQAADRFYVKYRDYMDQALAGRTDFAFTCFGLLPCISIFTDMLDKADDETRVFYYGLINRDAAGFGRVRHGETQVDSAVNQALAELCAKAVSAMENKGRKEKALFNLVIKRQLLTYLHSEMTTRIALLVAETAYESLPGYFDGLFDSKDAALSFTEQAARLHDLGKIYITDIVNMQRRRLDDDEFRGIRRHPELGAKVIENDPDLRQYKDVLLGHHRFYDGTGGYPLSFDNTASPVRRIIDIVTLADCLDAATDGYSRNYKPSKTLQELIGEFVEGAGTRYNPELVAMLQADTGLQEKLADITVRQRLELMYEAYSEGREKYI